MSRAREIGTDAPLLAWGEALRAAKARRARQRRWLAGLGFGAGVMLASAALPPTPRLVWNATASAPIGLYWVVSRAPIVVGDTVVARLPDAARRLAARRHYLPANIPLVKRVAADSGQEICAIGAQIFIDGAPVARRRAVDGHGRAMPGWQGCQRLHGGEVLLLNPDPASFDGRYFGGSEASDIIGKATLLWRR